MDDLFVIAEPLATSGFSSPKGSKGEGKDENSSLSKDTGMGWSNGGSWHMTDSGSGGICWLRLSRKLWLLGTKSLSFPQHPVHRSHGGLEDA